MGPQTGRIAVIDTNVIVAGLITRDAASPVAQVLDGMLAAAFPYALSDALLAEYGQVLARPAIARLHGLTSEEIELLLTDLAQHAIVLEPVAGPPAPDPGDQFLWDLLAARRELVLVTGDRALLQHAEMNMRVVSSQAFIQSWIGRT